MRWSDLAAIAGAGAKYLVQSKILRRPAPLVGGIAINDSCNLRCIQCGVSNRGIPDMSLPEIRDGLVQLRTMGLMVLYIEGGEPFIWHDDRLGLEDVISLARRLGFRWIIAYTNGTLPVRTSADTVFVSLDGLRDTNDFLRGKSYDKVLGNIAASSHPNLFINFTINRLNAPEVEPFCDEMSRVGNVRGIFFHFITPSGSNADLLVGSREKAKLVERLLRLKRRGVPVRNSRVALRRVRDDSWNRPSDLCYLYANRTMFRCCRSVGNAEVCEQCGYLGYAELDCISRLRLGAVREAIGALAGSS